MVRLAIAAVIAAGLSACQAWDSREAGRYYGYPSYGYGYPRGPSWYDAWGRYPYYAGPFGYERHLARERWLARERRRRAELHDGGDPVIPSPPGGGAGTEPQRPSVKVPQSEAAAAQARMQAARQQAIEAQRQRKMGLPPGGTPSRETPVPSAADKKKLPQ